MPSDPDASEHHLARAEYHLACARGADPDVHPAMFRLPGRHELEALRKGCGLSQKEVAEELGYTPGSIAAVESGSQGPGRELLYKLLRLYRREWPARAPDAVAVTDGGDDS